MSQLTAALLEFRGMTPDDIAALIRQRHIRGRAGTTYRCPMALLLSGTHPGQFVIRREFIIRKSGEVFEKATTPRNVAAFVRRFDIGGYPDLILPAPRCMAKPGEPSKSRKNEPSRSARNKPRAVRNKLAHAVNRFNTREVD